MFLASQFLLKRSQMCKASSVASYSVALGLVLYAGIYLYLLFFHQEWLSIFNKFVIYVVGVDLLLSAFFHFNAQKTQTHKNVAFTLLPNAEGTKFRASDTDADADADDGADADTTKLQACDADADADADAGVDMGDTEDLSEHQTPCEPSVSSEQPEEQVGIIDSEEEPTRNEVVQKRRGRPPKISVI